MTIFRTRVGYYQCEDVSLNDGPNFFCSGFFFITYHKNATKAL